MMLGRWSTTPLVRGSVFSLRVTASRSRMDLRLPFHELCSQCSCPPSSSSAPTLRTASRRFDRKWLQRRRFCSQDWVYARASPPSSASSSSGPPSFKKPDILSWSEDMNVNDVTLIGTIGRDVNLQYLSSGKVVATTSIKVKRRAQEYSWFLVEFWDDFAEIAAVHLNKDSYVFIAGSVWVETFLGKDGVERKLCKVIATDLKFVRSMREDAEDSVHDMSIEELWQDVFNNPSQWWDNRLNKKSLKYPDFKHKSSNKALWIDNYLTPSWVKERLALELRKGVA